MPKSPVLEPHILFTEYDTSLHGINSTNYLFPQKLLLFFGKCQLENLSDIILMFFL